MLEEYFMQLNEQNSLINSLRKDIEDLRVHAISLETLKESSRHQQKSDDGKVFKMKEHMKELTECRLNLTKSEAHLKTKQEYAEDLELKKKKLEEELDMAREETLKVN